LAKIDITRQARAPQTASVYIRTTAVTSSLTGEYDLEFVPITGISASVDGPAISGSLGPNAALIRSLNASNISGSIGVVSASISSRLSAAETELSLTLLSGSSQVKSLLPSGTISSSAQITSLPKVTSKDIKIDNIGGITVASIVNESNEPTLTQGQYLRFDQTSKTFIANDAPVGAQTMSFNSSTNALSIEGGNNVDLTPLAGGGGGGGGTALTASFSGSVASLNVRSIDFVGNAVTASGTGNAVTVTINTGSDAFDGNRGVTNPDLGDLVNFNAGTSGSLTDFIEKVFFTNSAPSISSSRATINEFEPNGTLVTTITATDSEQSFVSGSLSFRTGSSYTADKFTIHSASGQIKVKGHTTASLNTTNRGDGVLTHPFPVAVSDGFVTSSATIFIRVTPNTAPSFRTTSTAGSIIANQTGSVNENTTLGTTVSTIFLTDAESDTLTISPLSQSAVTRFSSSIADVAGGKRITITTATASFDFESITKHELFISASDQHHGNTSGSYLTNLPIRVNVTNNAAPTMAGQTFSVPEQSGSNTDHGQGANSNSQTNIGTITTSDAEGDTVTFTALTLTSGSGGSNANQNNPANDPFQVASNGTLQLKAGQYLNATLFNQYKYSATYKDNFNNASSSGVITINITEEPTPTVTNNLTQNKGYVIESATAGNHIKVNTDGRSGTQADFDATGTVSMSVSSSGFFALSGAGKLTLATAVSESAFTFAAGNAISGSVTATTVHGTTGTKTFCVGIAINNAPTPSFSNTSANLNTNGARPSNTLTTITFSDPESDTLDHNSFTFTDPSGQLTTSKVSDTYLVRASQNLSASAYQMTASIKDTKGFRVGTTKHSITIAQAGSGSMTTNGTFRIRDTATSGSKIVTNADGDPTGTQGDLGVTYSPNYNSQAVQNFTSSNAAIVISDTGALSVNTAFGGAGKQAGDTITSTINFQDQYGNFGTGSLTLNVVATPNLVYGYGWRGGSSVGEATTMASMGDTDADEVGVTSGSFIAMLQSGSIGSNFTPSFVGGLATLHKSASLTTMSDSGAAGISTLGFFNFAASERLCIIFPSSSGQNGKPASMYDGVPPDSTGTAREYYVYAKDAAIPGTIATGIYYFNLETPINGVSRWGMIFAEGKNTNNSRYFLMPDSASAP